MAALWRRNVTRGIITHIQQRLLETLVDV